MKDEFKNLFYTKKYIFILLAVLLVATFVAWFFIYVNPHDFEQCPHYDMFIRDIKPYDTQEELQKLYDATNINYGDGMQVSTNEEKLAFLRSVYSFSLKNNLPYDSLVLYSTQSEYLQYTQFDYFISFSSQLGLFIFLSCLIIGCFYQSSDISSKIGKLVYTSGIKRSKIIAIKYIVSMLVIMLVVTLTDIIMSLFGLMYRDSGAKYCIVFATNYKLYAYTYFQIVLATIASHLLSVFCTYTFAYFLSVILKNGIIPFAVIMCSSVVLLFVLSNTSIPLIAMAMGGGIIQSLNQSSGFTTDMQSMVYYIPLFIISVLPAFISIPFIKKADYSR